ncbi:bifunctional nuclease family protein [Corynebacterium auris]|uniref:bifunctional nuclease family protein n=1 Tax=Corynebacterium auris TaxID=44750 RepID=UPI0025B40F9D|nr:bifunctional nuclease family protein [Corynebacterium auris]WJY68015.1 hypothetical protein CAURIS_05560 [Corynebacterium auris]
MVPISVTGVFPLGPENFLCALLHAPDQGRFLPVWLPPVEGAQLLARLSGASPSRPGTHDVLGDVIAQSGRGVNAIEISSYYNGVFMATLTLGDGTEYDLRASDALVLAAALDESVEVDETVLAQAGVRISAADLSTYFNLNIDTGGDAAEGDSASGDAAADAEFEQLMRDLGVEEGDLGEEQ